MTIKHIVLSEGGYNGLYMLGCMNKLLEKFIDIINIKQYMEHHLEHYVDLCYV